MEPLQHLGIALGLGLLVGLQREWSDKEIAGIRTFPLITILGALSGILAASFGGWVVAAGLLAVAALLVQGNVIKLHDGDAEPGMTTEVAALLMFVVGAALPHGLTAAAVVTTGGVAVLLHWKNTLHSFVDKIGEQDFKAIIQLVLIALVIAPLLPDREIGPYGVISPFKIWLMVVLIQGITLAAYMISRLLGPRTGTILAGVLGGLISSTATSVSYARRTKESPDQARIAALVILIASTVVFARVGVEIAAVAPEILRATAPPLAAMMVWMTAISAVAFFRNRGKLEEPEEHEAPTELKAAIIFGLLYALVLVAVAAAKEHFGDRGLYAVAALSGLTDMDAITLSTAQMVKTDRVEADLGWRLILVGGMANLVFKAGVVATLGTRRLLRQIALLFGLSLAGGVAILVLWP